MNDIQLYDTIKESEKNPKLKEIPNELLKLYHELYIEETENFDLIKENENFIIKLLMNNISFSTAISIIKKEV